MFFILGVGLRGLGQGLAFRDGVFNKAFCRALSKNNRVEEGSSEDESFPN